MDRAYHLPVMLREVIDYLDPKPGEVTVDHTIGGGGHAEEIASRIGPGGRLIGVDRDPEAIAEASRRLSGFGDVVTLVLARFDDVPRALDEAGIAGIDGALFDLGVSSHQLDTPSRGFSFKDPDAALDMRMNPVEQGKTAADLVNELSERDLTILLRENSDERWAARIAQFIVERRRSSPLTTVGQLIDVVHAAIPAAARPPEIHAATRTFQALRIAVNDELNILGHALESAFDRLNIGGRLVVLSYHSLEDRIVKQFFARLAGRSGGDENPYGLRPPALIDLLTKKPAVPSPEEVASNVRARSAKLRAVRKIGATRATQAGRT